MTTTLPTPVTLRIADRPTFPNQPAPEMREVTVSTLTLRQAVDDPLHKRVSVTFFETRFPVTIWQGADYDAAGNWTQAQLEAAVAAAITHDASKVVTQALSFPVAPSAAERKATAARIKAAFPNGLPRPAWAPAPPAPAAKK